MSARPSPNSEWPYHKISALATCKTLVIKLSPCVLVQPDGWARGEREGYGGPYDVTSLSLSLSKPEPEQTRGAQVPDPQKDRNTEQYN